MERLAGTVQIDGESVALVITEQGQLAWRGPDHLVLLAETLAPAEVSRSESAGNRIVAAVKELAEQTDGQWSVSGMAVGSADKAYGLHM